MDLDLVWNQFLSHLAKQNSVCSCKKIHRAGIPFLYVYMNSSSGVNIKEAETVIHTSSRWAMKGLRLTYSTHFVRVDAELYVFRHRFLVPQEKMFCCGNLCEDCIWRK
ncbi:hypothetical protein GJU40_05910 [Bacillus lacus]|uniref:Uncharacterized protein n=1 Tax=Metabacillus lacus TaxID=1983721 RepID=A0A7X2IY24_9BACI|nr:hypothetical protein [Metabacillus lacus]MRX71709.1 hypothetical protein [Metabacillus lacus]